MRNGRDLILAFEVHHLIERDRASVHADGQRLNRFDVFAVLLLHPQYDGKAPLLLVEAADHAAGHSGLEQASDAADVETITSNGSVIGSGAENGALAQGSQAVHFRFACAGDLL